MSLRLPRPDFLHPVARPGLLAWAWCACGLLVLLVGALDARSAWQALQDVARPSALVAAPVRPAQAALAAQDLGEKRAAEARRWRQRLAHPWPELWAASEQAGQAVPGPLAWLSVEHDDAGQLRLAGWAQDAALAQQAAASLRQQTRANGPMWSAVRVANVERTSEGHRFDIVARLAGLPAFGGSRP